MCREVGFSCHNVTPLPKNHHSTLFTTGYKRLTEGGHQAFVLGRLAFWCWRLLEGKRIAEGKRLLKGTELLKGNC
jgi:hypothetical protein